DFGLARRLDVGLQTMPGDHVGTPAYMAPEQAAGRTEELGPATDVFGLGAILYECLTRKPPYPATSRDEALRLARKGEVVPPRRLQPRVPAALERICLEALCADPAGRPSAQELAGELRGFLRRRNRGLVVAGLALVLLLAGAGWLA